MSDIKVGSEWMSKKDNHIIIKVVYYDLFEVVTDFGFSKGLSVFDKKTFLECFQPYIEFKWVKINSVRLCDEFEEVFGTYWNRKDFELLHNYIQYHYKFDDVEFDFVYIITYDNEDGEYVVNELLYNDCFDLLTPTFSTKEHAEMFLKLAKENDCL